MLVAGFLLVVGTLGCGEKPGPVTEPGPGTRPEPVAEPMPVVEVEAEPKPVAEEAKQSPPGPEVGRDAAIAAIDKLGGHYECDEESPERPIVMVGLIVTQVTDAALEHLKGLTNLEELDLTYTQVTDAGLEHLRGLTSLADARDLLRLSG